MQVLGWLLGFDPDELLDEIRRIREAEERIASALDRLAPPGFVDPRRKPTDLYKPRMVQSEK